VASVLVQADNDHDDMLATLNVRKPSREQFRGAEASAAAHLVGLGESRANPLSMFGKQTWMRLGYMRFALPAELDLTTDISAKKSRHTDEQDTPSAKLPERDAKSDPDPRPVRCFSIISRLRSHRGAAACTSIVRHVHASRRVERFFASSRIMSRACRRRIS
jgi:hypothetical protein